MDAGAPGAGAASAAEPSAAPASSFLSGTVKSWNEATGTGTITPNSGNPPEVDVERSVLSDGSSLLVGAVVTFELGTDAATGRPKATMAVGASNGPQADQSAMGSQGPPMQMQMQQGPPMQMSGNVMQDNLFITGLPPDSTEESVRQIFQPYGAVLNCKVMSTQGKPDKAALVRMADPNQAKWLVDNLDRNIPMGLSTPINVKYSQTAPPANGKPPPAQITTTGQRVGGSVKVWMEDRGMGFITSNNDGNDHFVHRVDLVDGGSLVQGSQVTFEAGWDLQKNKAVAKQVTGAIPNQGKLGKDGGWGKGDNWGGNNWGGGGKGQDWGKGGGGGWGGNDWGKGGGKGKDFGGKGGKDKGGKGKGKGKGKSKNMWEGEQKEGIVKVWFEDKGFGFVSAGDGSGDAYVHRTIIENQQSLQQGQPVTYMAAWDGEKQRWTARWCGPSSGNPGVDTSNMKTGTVKVWFEEKGFGFITADDGTGDIFVHRTNLTDGPALVMGARVHFVSEWSQEKNKFLATKVIGASMEGKGGGGGAPQQWSGGCGMPPQQQAPAQPSDQVMISGLPATATQDSVRGIFGPYGQITDLQMTGTGVAKITMGNTAQAEWLVQNLNGNMPVGLESPITVAFAPKEAVRYAPY